MVVFDCNNSVLTELNRVSKLVDKVRTRVNYKSEIKPSMCCKRGDGVGQFNSPYGLTVDNTTG